MMNDRMNELAQQNMVSARSAVAAAPAPAAVAERSADTTGSGVVVTGAPVTNVRAAST
jgi:hypothetical protein